MTKLFKAIIPEAQEDLIRDNVIELVTVIVEVMPHPDRPDDRSAMRIAAEVYHDFREGTPRIDNAIARIRRTCSMAEEDLSPATRSSLLAALDQRCREVAEFKEGTIDGKPIESLFSPEVVKLLNPEFYDLNARVTVWCFGWNVAMDDAGLMEANRDEPLIFKGIDDESRARVLERVRKVDTAIGATVYDLMRENE